MLEVGTGGGHAMVQACPEAMRQGGRGEDSHKGSCSIGQGGEWSQIRGRRRPKLSPAEAQIQQADWWTDTQMDRQAGKQASSWTGWQTRATLRLRAKPPLDFRLSAKPWAAPRDIVGRQGKSGKQLRVPRSRAPPHAWLLPQPALCLSVRHWKLGPGGLYPPTPNRDGRKLLWPPSPGGLRASGQCLGEPCWAVLGCFLGLVAVLLGSLTSRLTMFVTSCTIFSCSGPASLHRKPRLASSEGDMGASMSLSPGSPDWPRGESELMWLRGPKTLTSELGGRGWTEGAMAGGDPMTL